MQGKVAYNKEKLARDAIILTILAGKYVVFSMNKSAKGKLSGEVLKKLVHYSFTKWIPFNSNIYDSSACHFACFQGKKVYYLVPVLEQEHEAEECKTYGVDIWTNYIDENINSDFTTIDLARYFGYSGTQFKRKPPKCMVFVPM